MPRKRKYAVDMKVVRLVKKLQKHILEEPKRLHMEDWVQTYDNFSRCYTKPELAAQFPTCGTTACIAGWIGILTNKNVTKDERGFLKIPVHENYPLIAANALGLSPFPLEEIKMMEVYSGEYDGPACKDNLFYASRWPRPYRDQYRKVTANENKQKQAEVACARLEYFITTGK